MKSTTRRGLRMRIGGTVASVLVAIGVSVAPGAAAADVQSEQWYLGPMQTEKMWEVSKGEGIKVAVIDSGVNPHTPSLEGQVVVDEINKQASFGATNDYRGHGTSMAELIAGTGAQGGVQGLAPDAKIVPYRIAFESWTEGAAEDRERAPTTKEALKAAADSDAQIISMSFGARLYEADVQETVKYAVSKGKLLIAGVGNDGKKDGYIGYPAAYHYVVGVSSIDQKSHISEFASSGQYVDLVAPGENIPGYCKPDFDTYCHDLEGTSSATAITSGAAALIWSAHPDWTANQVTRALIDTAGRTWPKDDPTKNAGYGTIRPRSVLANPDYDPGAPYSDPLAKENTREGEKLVTEIPPASASPKPSAGATAASQGAEGSSADKQAAAGSDDAKAASADASNDSGSALWITLGAAAAVVVIGGVAFAVLRARRAN